MKLSLFLPGLVYGRLKPVPMVYRQHYGKAFISISKPSRDSHHLQNYVQDTISQLEWVYKQMILAIIRWA